MEADNKTLLQKREQLISALHTSSEMRRTCARLGDGADFRYWESSEQKHRDELHQIEHQLGLRELFS